MKLFLKILLGLVLLIVVFAAGFTIYVTQFLPNVDAPEHLALEYTPERIERGAYLANEVMGCVGCHGQRDYSRFAGPIIPSTKGSGGELWDEKVNFPGVLYAPNITPAAVGDWTDAELFRAITAGVDKDGGALFPIMPFHQYGKLPKEDIYAVIAYIRQLKPTESTFPERSLDFPLNLIVNFMPKEGTHHLSPNPEDPVKHGEYMITAAVCYDCHTPFDGQKYIDELAYSGGNEFKLASGGIVRAPNLTPDKKTGIGTWTEKQFVDRFKAYADSSFVWHKVKPGEFNSYMPWEYYSTLKEEDLKAMYAYLMSLDPIENKVVKFTPED